MLLAASGRDVAPPGMVPAMLPEVVSARVAAGAEFLVNPSNDSWVADETYAALQFDIVALRSVEQRRWLVRASTAGPSALVDPWGTVHGATAPGTQAITGGAIAPRNDRTVYGRVGDAFAVGCALVTGWTMLRRSSGRRDVGRRAVRSPAPPVASS